MTPEFKEGDKVYIITRRDMSPGYQGVQSIHAMRQFSEEHPDIDKAWFKQSNYLAWLSVTDEAELFELLAKAARKHIRCSIFREPDVDNQVTAIALEPGVHSSEVCRHLPPALRELNK